MNELKITQRELLEIKQNLFYVAECNHGTAGHNQMVLIAKLAEHIGFRLEVTDGMPVFAVVVPEEVTVTK